MTTTDYVTWTGDSADAADTEADDLEQHGDWIGRAVYAPWAVSGDIPGPEEVLRRRPDLADDPSWEVWGIGSNDGDVETWYTGLTLAEALELA